MTKFININVKIGNTGYTLFKLNYGYYFYIYFKNEINLCSKSYLANKLVKKLKDLMSIC